MKKDEVKQGGFYLRSALNAIREVVNIDPDGDVRWRAYDLATGQPSDDGICSLQRLATWADREATEEEIGRIQIGWREPTSTMKNALKDIMVSAVAAADDDSLIAELVKRGYKVEKGPS